jgi:hypothetical protein
MRTRKRSAHLFQKLFFSFLVLVTLASVGFTPRAFDTVRTLGTNDNQEGGLNSLNPSAEKLNKANQTTGTGVCQVIGRRLTSIEPKIPNIEMDITLGCGDDKRDCLGLSLMESKITADIYTPESMPFPTDKKWIELIPDTTREVRQVFDSYIALDQTSMPSNIVRPIRQARTPTALVDVTVFNKWEYDFRFYRPENIGPKRNGLYTVNNSPFVIYKFKNPNPPAVNRLQISKTKNGAVELSEYFYDEAQDGWVLTTNGTVVTTKQSVVDSSDPCKRVETLIHQNHGTTTKTIKVYRGFGWGQEFVKKIEDADGKAITTTMTFYDDPNRPHYGLQRTLTLPDGRVLHRFIPEYPQ